MSQIEVSISFPKRLKLDSLSFLGRNQCTNADNRKKVVFLTIDYVEIRISLKSTKVKVILLISDGVFVQVDGLFNHLFLCAYSENFVACEHVAFG